ncbi:MAG: cytochrome c biogenesis protein CcsA [Proteobacteria bacterium]|nr:cytochrome c biogenesis protein CcsA [Pseudomonadota bacterium]
MSNYIERGDFSFSTLSGLFLFGSLLVILIYFVVDFYFPNEIFEIIFPPLTISFLLLSKLIADQSIGTHDFLDKSPVFGRLILYIHGSFTMLGYLLFGVACLTSIFFLYQEKQIKNKTLHLGDGRVPSLGFLDSLNYKVIAIGFLFLTVGVLVGIAMRVIANEGHPSISLRQILPVTTWGVYAVFLLDRTIQGNKGKTTAIWSITGFICAVSSFIYEMIVIINR